MEKEGAGVAKYLSPVRGRIGFFIPLHVVGSSQISE